MRRAGRAGQVAAQRCCEASGGRPLSVPDSAWLRREELDAIELPLNATQTPPPHGPRGLRVHIGGWRLRQYGCARCKPAAERPHVEHSRTALHTRRRGPVAELAGVRPEPAALERNGGTDGDHGGQLGQAGAQAYRTAGHRRFLRHLRARGECRGSRARCGGGEHHLRQDAGDRYAWRHDPVGVHAAGLCHVGGQRADHHRQPSGRSGRRVGVCDFAQRARPQTLARHGAGGGRLAGEDHARSDTREADGRAEPGRAVSAGLHGRLLRRRAALPGACGADRPR